MARRAVPADPFDRRMVVICQRVRRGLSPPVRSCWKPRSNRFSSSKGVKVPKPERIRCVGYSFCDVAQAVFDDLPPFVSYQLRWGMTRWKDGLWWILDTNIRPKEVL